MNRLAASVQFWAEPKIALVIPKSDFRPAPEVDSATVVLRTKILRPDRCRGTSFKKGGIDPPPGADHSPFPKGSPRRGRDFGKGEVIGAELYYKTVRVLFAQPRKTIMNNIADGLKIPKKDVSKILERIGIDENLRPQNLSLEDIIEIARNLA